MTFKRSNHITPHLTPRQVYEERIARQPAQPQVDGKLPFFDKYKTTPPPTPRRCASCGRNRVILTRKS